MNAASEPPSASSIRARASSSRVERAGGDQGDVDLPFLRCDDGPEVPQDGLPGGFEDNRAAALGRAKHLLVIGDDLHGKVDRVLVEGGGTEPVRPRPVAEQVVDEVALVRPYPVDGAAGNAGVTD